MDNLQIPMEHVHEKSILRKSFPFLSHNKITCFLQILKSLYFISDAITAEDAIHFYWRMEQSPLQCARSRRPLSVDDVQVAEAFLFRTSLDDVYESPGDDSGVFLPSPLSSSHSFSCDERKGKSTPDIPVTLKTPMPNAHRWLHSCTEGILLAFTCTVCIVCVHTSDQVLCKSTKGDLKSHSP